MHVLAILLCKAKIFGILSCFHRLARRNDASPDQMVQETLKAAGDYHTIPYATLTFFLSQRKSGLNEVIGSGRDLCMVMFPSQLGAIVYNSVWSLNYASLNRVYIPCLFTIPLSCSCESLISQHGDLLRVFAISCNHCPTFRPSIDLSIQLCFPALRYEFLLRAVPTHQYHHLYDFFRPCT